MVTVGWWPSPYWDGGCGDLGELMKSQAVGRYHQQGGDRQWWSQKQPVGGPASHGG